MEVLRWAAMSFGEHNAQLYLALALLCKGSALVTVKNTEVNNGLEAWRGLNATYNSNNKFANEYGCSTCYSRNVPSRFHRRLKQSRDGNAT